MDKDEVDSTAECDISASASANSPPESSDDYANEEEEDEEDDLDEDYKARNSANPFNAAGGSRKKAKRSRATAMVRRTCSADQCGKDARSGSSFCIKHGGGPRCVVSNCTRGARDKSGFCIRHGGGPRCGISGCKKGAEKKNGFCILHGRGGVVQRGRKAPPRKRLSSSSVGTNAPSATPIEQKEKLLTATSSPTQSSRASIASSVTGSPRLLLTSTGTVPVDGAQAQLAPKFENSVGPSLMHPHRSNAVNAMGSMMGSSAFPFTLPTTLPPLNPLSSFAQSTAQLFHRVQPRISPKLPLSSDSPRDTQLCNASLLQLQLQAQINLLETQRQNLLLMQQKQLAFDELALAYPSLRLSNFASTLPLPSSTMPMASANIMKSSPFFN